MRNTILQFIGVHTYIHAKSFTRAFSIFTRTAYLFNPINNKFGVYFLFVPQKFLIIAKSFPFIISIQGNEIESVGFRTVSNRQPSCHFGPTNLYFMGDSFGHTMLLLDKMLPFFLFSLFLVIVRCWLVYLSCCFSLSVLA